MDILLISALMIPFLSFLILIFSPLSRTTTAILGCGSIFISFILFLTFLFIDTTLSLTLFTWIPLKEMPTSFSLQLDHLSLVMTLIITGVGFLIHLYSIGYMEEERDYVRYFACMNFFIFAMLLLVLAKNLLVLFIGWEGVGLASYLLIGFWYQRRSAASAALKAFIVNRIGDLGLLLGILLSFYLFGSVDFQEITEKASSVNVHILTILTLLLFIGAIGKSAQLPLQVWLPDAMEGPTPVSALIHAATMVTAGVYLLIRLHTLYLMTPLTLQVAGTIGAFTALYAALSALFQTDLKRVLAYSTISQLGLMFLACGAGAFYSAIFHLTGHAFVKALLFLSAGIVIHKLHGKTLMSDMGGLKDKFPKTHWLYLIGVLALSGLPPFITFFSKDLILEQEYLSGFTFLFWIAFASSFLTGIYMTRSYILTFLGTKRNENNIKDNHTVMLIPVFLLAFFTVIGGILSFRFEHFLAMLGVNLGEEHLLHTFLISESGLAIVSAVLAVSGTFLIYHYLPQKLFSISFFRNGFYFDTFYEKVLVLPFTKISSFLKSFLEPKFFQEMLDQSGTLSYKIAKNFQKLQSGQIRSYVALMVIGISLLIFYMVLV
jgi:NADH-quinone oxidoreductase subunit L